jgi:hypothetical protein
MGWGLFANDIQHNGFELNRGHGFDFDLRKCLWVCLWRLILDRVHSLRFFEAGVDVNFQQYCGTRSLKHARTLNDAPV